MTTSNKHKGDVMERRWIYEQYDGKHGIFEGSLLIAVVGECFARSESARDVAQEVVRVWNEHDTLVEQRDLLVGAAKNVVERLQDLPRFLEKNNSQVLATIAAECLADLAVAIPADNPLATVEQGHETLASAASDDEQGEGQGLPES